MEKYEALDMTVILLDAEIKTGDEIIVNSREGGGGGDTGGGEFG